MWKYICLVFFLSTVSATESGYIQGVLLDHPSSYWRLNTATGTQILDEIAGVALTSVSNFNSITFTPGIFPIASPTNLAITGYSQFSSATPIIPTLLNPTSYAIELWSYQCTSPLQIFFTSGIYVIIQWTFSTGPTSVVRYITGGGADVSIIVANNYQDDNHWHHFVLSNNQGNMTMYFDGQPIVSFNVHFTFLNYIQVGSGQPNIKAAHVATYNYNLSAARILTHYQNVFGQVTNQS